MNTQDHPSIFENPYDKEVLADNMKHDSAKTKNALLIIAAILFLSDLLALSMANALNGTTLIYIIVVPAIYAALGILAVSKPMLSMSLAAIIFIGIIAYNVYALGTRSIISGLLIKAVVIYFFVKGFSHAKDAEEAKRKLSSINR